MKFVAMEATARLDMPDRGQRLKASTPTNGKGIVCLRGHESKQLPRETLRRTWESFESIDCHRVRGDLNRKKLSGSYEAMAVALFAHSQLSFLTATEYGDLVASLGTTEQRARRRRDVVILIPVGQQNGHERRDDG